MTKLRQDLVYAWRTLAKAPGFTTIAVLVLAVGIGANSAMLSLVNELLLRPLWGGDTPAVVGIYSRDRTVPDSYRSFSYPNYLDIRESRTFESVLAQAYTLAGTPAGEGTRRVLAAVVSSNYFDTLGVDLLAGRGFTAEEERPGSRPTVAISSHAAWEAAGRPPGYLGSTIRLNGDDYTIVGITPQRFTGMVVLLTPEVFLPLGAFDAIVRDEFKNNGRGLADRGNHGLILAGRISPGMSDTDVQSRLSGLGERMAAAYPGENANQELSIHTLSRIGVTQGPADNTAIAIFTSFVLALSGIVLVIACLNIANMLLARGAARRQEVAVRMALGAGRARVVRQLLTESALLAVAGGALGLLFNYLAAKSLVASMASALPFTINLTATPDLSVILGTFGTALTATLLFGLGPALGLSRRDLIADLRDRSREGSVRKRRLNTRNVLVVAQIALSLALLTSGGVFARTTLVAASGRPGYSYERLILASTDTRMAGTIDRPATESYTAIMTGVRSMPGLEAASISSSIPFGESQEGRQMERVGPGGPGAVRARSFRVIGANYFKTLGLGLKTGREFSAAEETSAGAPQVAIIDELMARELFGSAGAAGALGQMIRVARDENDPASSPGAPMEIVGIAPPLREELLQDGPVPHVYVPAGRHMRSTMFVQVRLAPGVNEQAALDELRRTLRRVSPELPILSITSMQAFHDTNIELWALQAGAYAFAGIGVLAMLLATVGVYGVRAYMVALRTREIGIRMALGATPRGVLGLVLREGAWLTGAGLAIGVPLGLMASVALRSVFVGIGGVDLVALIVSTSVLGAAATLAGAVPARRATRVQPVKALAAD